MITPYIAVQLAFVLGVLAFAHRHVLRALLEQPADRAAVEKRLRVHLEAGDLGAARRLGEALGPSVS
ncbi:MAG: hypothetical protein KC417_16375, partial [Myxococcales bacterium]|nr:hypothetical protein [Myxococcales bacterium]